MNKTYENIIDALHCTTRTWNKVKDNLDLVTVVNCKGDNAYSLFFRGIFLGAFIKKEYVDVKELKDTPFTYEKNLILGY